MAVVALGVVVWVFTRPYVFPEVHPQRGRRVFGHVTVRRDPGNVFPEMMSSAAWDWATELAVPPRFPLRVPPVTYYATLFVASRRKWFVVGCMGSSQLDSQLVLILWHESLRENPGALSFRLRGVKSSFPCQVVSMETVPVPTAVQADLMQVMASPPSQVLKVRLACAPGLQQSGKVRVEVRRTDVVVPVWDYLEYEPHWAELVCHLPSLPWVELGVDWELSRKEQYLRRMVDTLPPYGTDRFLDDAPYMLRYVISPELDTPLRWKVLQWLEEIDQDRVLLSGIARREIRSILEKNATGKPSVVRQID